MVTTRSAPVCYLWDSMTSFEKASFMQCIVSTIETRLVTGNVDAENVHDKYDIDDIDGVMGVAKIESAKQLIVDALNDNNGDTQNMLVKLVNNNEATLAMKLLTKMAASDDWRSFVQRSLNDDCVGGGTLLHEAAKYGCIDDLREFITTDLLMKLEPNDNGETPLHLAAAHGHEKDIEVLLGKPVVFTRNKKGWTPLHYAVSSKKPSVNIVSSLIQYVLVHDPLALDAQSDEYRNTALHLACRNKNTDEKLLTCFKEADPMICNTDRQTPLHLAAGRERDPHPIAVLLGLFLPRISKNNLTLNDLNNDQPQRQHTFYFSGKSLVDTLLIMCAKNGHRVAVALLLHSGADPKNVLHDIVDESVKRPDKITDLLAVYEAIVENVVVPDSRWLAEDEVENNMARSLNNYNENRRLKVIALVEEPNSVGKNVIERAIEAGAKDLLLAILNTPNVFRIDDVGNLAKYGNSFDGGIIHYDVTNMIPWTLSSQKTSSDGGTSTRTVHRPAKSYMELITDNECVWREHDILRMEPFRELTKAYVTFMRFFDLVAGFLHLAFMITLSLFYLPEKCSLNEQFSLNLTTCNTTVDGYYNNSPCEYFIVWPVMIGLAQLVAFISYMVSVCRAARHLRKKRDQYDEVRNVSGAYWATAVKLLYKVVDKLPFYAFSAMTIWWYFIHSTPLCYNCYLEVISMVFLFGWLINIILFCRCTKDTYVLSLVLKSVLIQDMVFNFAPVFLISVIAFTCTFHVLQMTLIESTMNLDETFYEIFSTAFSVGNLFDYTIDPEYLEAGGNRAFLKTVYLAYLSLSALILFNYLIAMMSHRYEKETPRAENAWRFDCVTDVMQLEKHRFAYQFARLFHQLHQMNYSGDRWYITVPRWRPWLKDSNYDD